MAEGLTDDKAGDHPEPPARSVNRRRVFEERVAAARNTKEVLRALAGYLQGMFSRHSLEDVKDIAGNLADDMDMERRRHCGPRDGA
jgi:hypothetical protein